MVRLLPEGREIAKPFALGICILMSDVKVIRPRVLLQTATFAAVRQDADLNALTHQLRAVSSENWQHVSSLRDSV